MRKHSGFLFSFVVLSQITGCSSFLLGIPPILSTPILLPQDQEGWTQFTPSSDTRLIYISEDGDDGTGNYHSPSNTVIGDDPFNPVGSVKAFRTYAVAKMYARSGYPDWILFERGGTYPAEISNPNSGRGKTEFALISSYGEGALPAIIPTASGTTVLSSGNREFMYFALTNLDIYNPYHDPDNGSFYGYSDDAQGFSLYSLAAGAFAIKQILFEGVKFRYFASNSIQAVEGSDIHEFVIRRCTILDNYYTTDSHAQGIYASHVTGLIIEESVFDHNGWYDKPSTGSAPATIFNHNTYFANCHNIIFRNNIFLRSSSMQNKFTANDGVSSATNIELENNLYVDGEIGIGIGGNYDTPYKFANITVIGNVFTEIGRSRPTERGLGWGIEIIDWDGGSVEENYFLHNTTADVTNSFGLSIEGGIRNVKITGNVIYNLNAQGTNTSGSGIRINQRDTKTDIVISDNLIQEPNNSFKLIDIKSSKDAAGFTFKDNRYYQTEGTENAFLINGSDSSLFTWRTLTDDTSTFRKIDFYQPTRNIAGYQQHLGETATIDAFISACRAQDRINWDTRYTADVVNAWLKAGFRGK